MTDRLLDVAALTVLLVFLWAPLLIRSAVSSPTLRRMKGLGVSAGVLLGLTLLAIAVLLSWGIAYWATVDSAGFLMRVAVMLLSLYGCFLFLAHRVAALQQKLADRDREAR